MRRVLFDFFYFRHLPFAGLAAAFYLLLRSRKIRLPNSRGTHRNARGGQLFQALASTGGAGGGSRFEHQKLKLFSAALALVIIDGHLVSALP